MKKPFCDSCGQEITEAPIMHTGKGTGLCLEKTLTEDNDNIGICIHTTPSWFHWYYSTFKSPTNGEPEICRDCYTKQLQKLIDLNNPTSVAK